MDLKILHKVLTNYIHAHIQRIILHDQVGFISEIHEWFDIQKSTNIINHRLTQNINHIIISIDIENPTPFHDKNPRESKYGGNIFEHIKGHLRLKDGHQHIKWIETQSISNIIRNKVKVSAFTAITQCSA